MPREEEDTTVVNARIPVKVADAATKRAAALRMSRNAYCGSIIEMYMESGLERGGELLAVWMMERGPLFKARRGDKGHVLGLVEKE